MVELESGKRTSENEQEESRLREEQTKNQTAISTLLGNEDIEKVQEEHLKEEHEVQMRILKKKEQLLDLKLQLFRRNLTF